MKKLEKFRHYKIEAVKHMTFWTHIPLGLLFLCFVHPAHPWSFSNLLGPSIDDIEFSYTWRHATTADWRDPNDLFRTRIIVLGTFKNKSSYYLSQVKLTCNFYDASRNRIVKDEEFSWHPEDYSIAPGNTGTWTFSSSTFSLTDASNAECKLARVSGDK